jgi:hypothetical protein
MLVFYMLDVEIDVFLIMLVLEDAQLVGDLLELDVVILPMDVVSG